MVCKFGGTSLGDLECVRRVAERLAAMQGRGRSVVAVLSAMGETTDHLVELGYRISSRPQPRELDALLSLGESMACAVVAMAVGALGARALSLTGAQAGVRTDGGHGNAQLDVIRPHRILQALDDGHIVLVAGFQGISPAGDVTTLGRGGSDASAVAVAAALGVASCEIFTDVTGVFTADPRIVPSARQLTALNHEEMLLLAAAGAAVIQPQSVELALANDIAIRVRSTFSNAPGTWIRKEKPMLETTGIIGVAHRHRVSEDLGSVSIVGIGLGSRPEVAARVLAVLDHLGIDPSLVTTTPNGITCHLASARVAEAVCALHDAFELQHEATVRAAA